MTPSAPTLSIVCVLPADADAALVCLESLAVLGDTVGHDVVLVDDATYALDGLLARVEGVEVLRRSERGGLLAALTDALPKAAGDVVVAVWGGAQVDAASIGALVTGLTDPAVSAVTAANGRSAVPMATCAVAASAVTWATALSSRTDEPGSAAEDYATGTLLLALAAQGVVRAVPSAVIAQPTRRAGLVRAAIGADPELSIIVPTLDVTSSRVQATLRAIQERTPVPHEIIVVDNGAPPQGFSAPVNSGLRAARGQYMVVMNDDVEVLPGWWEPLRDALDGGASVVFPLTIDTAMRRDFAAWCFGLTRLTLQQFASQEGEFLEPAFRVWFQDTDLLHRLRLEGRPPVLVDASLIRHGLSVTVASPDPVLRRWIDEQIARDKLAFESRWGSSVAGAAK